jgi:Flp pilus assembly protein TadG
MSRLVRAIEALWSDRRGNFAVLFALTAPLLVIIVGMGVDYYVGLSDKSRLDTAADAAALAAVNTAKAYYAANSGAQSGTTLQNNALAAGKAQGAKVFAANVGSVVLAGSVTPQITWQPSTNLTFTVNVTWNAQVAAHFGPLVGISSINIHGDAAATTGLPKYLDFYLVVDTSGSMGIPTNAADQQTLIETNPDNPIEAAAGYKGGCQFACHFAGYQGFNFTQTNKIPLKLNSVGASVQALLSTATDTEIIANQFRIGIYPFIVKPIVAAPLSSDFSTANTVAGNLANYLDAGTNNSGMGSGGTHFENLWSGLSSSLQTPGTGLSTSSTLPFIILITDGVDNGQTYTNGNFSGSTPQVPTQTFCTNAKAAGYTVAVLLIPYDSIVDPEPIWNDEDGVVNSLIANNQISPAMQKCSSPGYFFSAATSADINNAMQTIFYQAVQSARLTQ